MQRTPQHVPLLLLLSLKAAKPNNIHLFISEGMVPGQSLRLPARASRDRDGRGSATPGWPGPRIVHRNCQWGLRHLICRCVAASASHGASGGLQVAGTHWQIRTCQSRSKLADSDPAREIPNSRSPDSRFGRDLETGTRREFPIPDSDSAAGNGNREIPRSPIRPGNGNRGPGTGTGVPIGRKSGNRG